MTTKTRSVDSVYAEIAELTGKRGELERQRFLLIKAVRAIRAARWDVAWAGDECEQFRHDMGRTEDMLLERKSALWSAIQPLDNEIDRLTQLVQNGAFNAEN